MNDAQLSAPEPEDPIPAPLDLDAPEPNPALSETPTATEPDTISLLRPGYTVQLPVFSGPLDLLLQLIEREELEITSVALAQVTDQFVSYVRVMEQLNLGELADFLSIAARLILIKSEALLPRPVERAPGEEDPGEELARQLLAYKRYKQVALGLRQREDANLKTYIRLAPPPKIEKQLDLSNVTTIDLLEAVRRALAIMPPDTPELGTVVAPPKVTIRDQIRRLADAFKRSDGRVAFHEVLAQSASRMEIMVTFLAALELIKRRKVEAQQTELFGVIELVALTDWTDDEALFTELEFE
ncbi:MAG: segregation/condensation protein A [Anaerolineales bacterium]|nr:segregation/condensation protein A [Anaerolineales bacterium]